jgi:hypothetical protein
VMRSNSRPFSNSTILTLRELLEAGNVYSLIISGTPP